MMKHTRKLLTSLLLATATAHAGLVAHFRFDGDLKDATGRHDGRPLDAKLAPTFAPGRVGSAVVIERANAGIEVANPSAIDFSSDFTIAAWVNVGCYYAEMPVIFKGRADLTTAPDKFFGLFGWDGLQVHGEGQGEWITNFRASNGLVPNDGQWHHVAVTYRAASAPHFTLYVDGQGKQPADNGTVKGGDFTLQPDAPDSVLRAGGRGYIMKQEGPDKMKDAIARVLSGQVYASERTSAAILDALSRPRSSGSTSVLGKLTDRELEILRLIGQGKDSRQVAEDLHISLKTVDTHRGHLKEKLGLKNATELIHYAVRWVGELA